MRRLLNQIGTVVIVLGLAAGTSGPAEAGLVTYEVGSTSAFFHADTFTNNPFSTSITVPDGGSLLATLQTGTFTVGNSGTFTGSAPFTLPETFTANTISSSVSLVGTLAITLTFDTLTFTNLTPTTVSLPSGQTLTVTPQPLGNLTGVSGATIPYTLQANFALSPAVNTVPEPSTLVLAATSVLMMVGYYAWRRRRRAAA